mgnify:CR=1 FL=1
MLRPQPPPSTAPPTSAPTWLPLRCASLPALAARLGGGQGLVGLAAGVAARVVAAPAVAAAAPVAAALAAHGIAASGGDFYAVRPLQAMGVDLDRGVLRLSAAHYTSAEDVSRLIAALDLVL